MLKPLSNYFRASVAKLRSFFEGLVVKQVRIAPFA